MPRRVQLRVAFSPTFKKQATFGTALANGELTSVLTMVVDAQEHVEPVHLKEDVFDCTGQYKVDETVLHRYARLTGDLEINAQILGGLLALALGSAGAPSGGVHTLSMLGPTVFTLPVTTFIVGYADGSDAGVVFKDVAVESIVITAQVDQKLQVRVTFVGNGELPDASGFSFPDCTAITPLRLDTDALFTVNSVERIAITRRWEFTYANNLPLQSDPWTLASVDITRLERGNQRTVQVAWTAEGRLNDTLGAAARTVPPTIYPLVVRIGDAADGVQITAAESIYRFANPMQVHDGEVGRAAISTIFEPRRIPGNAATPISIAAANGQAGAYLTT